eukprot:Hpha_TRINITY_DN16914_c1_g2::TRINITY_DN16914_c1_g2_i2::g.53923::m.53923
MQKGVREDRKSLGHIFFRRAVKRFVRRRCHMKSTPLRMSLFCFLRVGYECPATLGQLRRGGGVEMRRFAVPLGQTVRKCAVTLPPAVQRPLALQSRQFQPPHFLSRAASTASAGYNRWLTVPPVLAIQASIGSMYAWSVFNNPLCREVGVIGPCSLDWEMTHIVPVFSTTACFFGLTCLLTPPWQEKVGPRATCLVASGCWAGGLAVAAAGTAMHSLPVLYLGYGVLGGLGFGFGYIKPTVNLITWFPDKRGLATGLSVSGFAGGAVVGAPLNEWLFKQFTKIPQLAPSGAEVLLSEGRRVVDVGGKLSEVVIATPEMAKAFPGVVEGSAYLVGTGNTGVAATFACLSSVYAVMMIWGTFAQRVPPPGYLPPALAAQAAAKVAEAAKAAEEAKANGTAPAKKELHDHEMETFVPLDQIMKMPQFYLFWLLAGGNAFAGVTIISAAKNIVSESFGVAVASLVTPAFASSFVVGLAVANVGGRLLWSAASDVIGRRNIFMMFGLVGVPTCAMLPTLTEMVIAHPSPFPVYAFCAGSGVLVSFYGASVAILPAYISDQFGVKNTTTVFGRCLTGWATAALVGPIAMSQLRSQSQRSALHDLATKVDPELFQTTFGAARGDRIRRLHAQISASWTRWQRRRQSPSAPSWTSRPRGPLTPRPRSTIRLST